MTSVQVNSYLSGPHRQGFDVHYDTHDVFVIQLQGAKTWSIFPPSMKWMGPRDQSLIAPETPYLNCVVSEGDVLYIPKGHWHAAVAQNSESLHLTVGIHARTGIDFLQWVVERLTHLPIDGAKWRQHLPATGKLTNHLAHLAQQTGLALDNPSLISAFIEHCQATTDDKMDHLHRVAASRAETPHIDPIVDQEAQPTHDDIRQAEKQAIAHALLSKGLEPAFIAEVTGLSRQDLLASADASRPPLGRPPQEPRL